MDKTNNRLNIENTDWISARKAADPEKTESPDAGGTLKAHFYTTGWLVCADGPEKGRDYRLTSGYNRIGRRYDLEVCIFEDPAISRDEHCRIAYDERSNTFYIVPGTGTLTYYNEVCLTEPQRLHTGDRIRIGDTTLEFIPYCREGVTW